MKKIILLGILFISFCANAALFENVDSTKYEKKIYFDILSGYQFGGVKNTIEIAKDKHQMNLGLNFLSVALHCQYHKNLMVGIKLEGLYFDFQRTDVPQLRPTSGVTAAPLYGSPTIDYKFEKSFDVAGNSINLNHTILKEITDKLSVEIELMAGINLSNAVKKYSYIDSNSQPDYPASINTVGQTIEQTSVLNRWNSVNNIYFNSITYVPDGMGFGANLGLSVFSSYELSRKISFVVSLGYRNTNLNINMKSESGSSKFVFKNTIDYLQLNIGLRFQLK